MSKSEERAYELYPDRKMQDVTVVQSFQRLCYQQGYEQAEKDLAPAFEFPFDVPDNDGHIIFTPMDNMTIRKELKLKKGERVIVSIRKEHEKE